MKLQLAASGGRVNEAANVIWDRAVCDWSSRVKHMEETEDGRVRVALSFPRSGQVGCDPALGGRWTIWQSIGRGAAPDAGEREAHTTSPRSPTQHGPAEPPGVPELVDVNLASFAVRVPGMS